MFYITSHHGYCFIKNKIIKLNRIAVKLQQPEIQFELIKTEMETDPKTKISQKMYYIFCVGEAPRLKDFSFKGTLEYTPKGNLIFPVNENSSKIPESFRTSEFICEDCKVKRFRTQLFILHNEKEDKWFSVGSTCLSSFLGVNESDVNQLAEFASTLASLKGTMDKWISKTNDSKKNNTYHGYKIEDLFASLFAYMRGLRGRRPTSYLTGYSFVAFKTFIYSPVFLIDSVTDEDKVMATNLIKYYRDGSYNPKYPNLFTGNMLTALQNELIAKRHYKFIREAFRGYMNKFHDTLFPVKKVEWIPVKPIQPIIPQTNAVTQVAIAPAPIVKVANGHIGKVGETITSALTLTVKEGKMVKGKFGNFCMAICKDNIGNEVIFSSNKVCYKAGERITVKSAIINKHSVYKNVNQTFIKNVKF